MYKGFIEVSEPLNYGKNQRITCLKDSKQIFCLLKGKLRRGNDILQSGDVYGLDNLLDSRVCSGDFTVIEDSTIITIKAESMDQLILSDKKLIKTLLISTVDYITDVKDNLLEKGLS